jgi:hypothetical protein
MDPAKQPPAINEKDEALIKEGIARSDTETRHSSESEKSHTEQDAEDSKIPIDGSHFTPTRTFYILRHNLFSKEINVIDISDEVGAVQYSVSLTYVDRVGRSRTATPAVT